MRIIAGKYRGKKLFSPKDESIRPTADRARESVFNIVKNRMVGLTPHPNPLPQGEREKKILPLPQGEREKKILPLPQGEREIRALDVFAGSGAFGLEALSRGAFEVCLIDKDVELARKNAALFVAEKDKIKVLKADACKLPKASEQYDLVFMDAPYNQGLSEKALLSMAEQGWLADGALVIVETEKNEVLELTDWRVVDERTYGIAKFWFLENIG